MTTRGLVTAVTFTILALGTPPAATPPAAGGSPSDQFMGCWAHPWERSPAVRASGASCAMRRAEEPGPPGERSSREPQLHVVATAHLDTQWRWTIRETIEKFLPATLKDNFVLFEKYPDYTFSFEGAFRYMLMKEYYPAEYERMRRYIAAGRWRVAGSWVDAVDVNIPSPESLIRQTLYGNGFFEREFGVRSRDVFLPDCFGFGFALPSIAAHCGLTGFSTQKLTWGSAVGVPFDIGLWEGVDGSTLIAALNPGEYVARLSRDLSSDSAVIATIERQGRTSGLSAAYRYFGTGDQGGAPTDESVAWLERSIHGGGPVRVRSVASDQLARELPGLLGVDGMRRLPRYRGELLMTDHGTGCYTSQSAMKRWNRKNERLADAAERAAVIADWLGGAVYPRETLRDAWVRFLWHQFHDDLTGTSIPEAYLYSWNDEAISQNTFAEVLADGIGAISRSLDTGTRGIPLVVYNPLAFDREDVVEASLSFDGTAPAHARVFGPGGREVPSQINGRDENHILIAFLASVPSVGVSVYDVRPSDDPCPVQTGLAAGRTEIENERYRVALDGDGNIASILDKRHGREILSSPLTLQLLADSPHDWAAWEVDYEDLMAPSRAVVGSPSRIDVIETGPARVALRIVRQTGGSTFTQEIRLMPRGAADRVEIENEIDWRSPGTLLKAAFPLSARNEDATYDLGLGVIPRGTNRPSLYEVPAQGWADLTDQGGGFGVAVMNDCKYGWDKPDDHTLRLSLVRTPEVNSRWSWIKDQRSMDLGRHRVTMALCAHEGDWRDGGIPAESDRLNQPLLAFQPQKHAGGLGREISFVRLVATEQRGASGDRPAWGRGARPPAPEPPPPAAVRAIKLAEDGPEIIIRVAELYGETVPSLRLRFASQITAAREVNGAEEPAGPVPADGTDLVFSLGPYQPRTFAVRLAPSPVQIAPPEAEPYPLPYNLLGITPCGTPTSVDFDGQGMSLPGDLLPRTFIREGIPFVTGPQEPDRPNVVACRGQRIPIRAGGFDRLYILAAAVGGDRKARFLIDGAPVERTIQDYEEPIGQWDSRISAGELHEDPAAITPAYVKPAPVAWIGTHRHRQDGAREAYSFAHFFKIGIDLPPGAQALSLPADDRIRILAITAVRNGNDEVAPAQPLYDRPGRAAVMIDAPHREFLDSVSVRLHSPNPDAVIRYTLDGGEPSPLSPVYKNPITIAATSILKARAFASGMEDPFVASALFTRLTPRRPENPASLETGLVCRTYAGRWDKLPAFLDLDLVRKEVLPAISVPAFVPPENYACTFTGYINIPRDGMYTFHLWSDDGSALHIDGSRVIDNDGLHGNGEQSARLALGTGLHPIRVTFFQGPGDAALDLLYEGPGIALQPVPAGAYFHTMAQINEPDNAELRSFDRLWDYDHPDSTETKFRALLPKVKACGDPELLVQLLTQIARTEGLQRKFEAAHATLDQTQDLLRDEMKTGRVRYLLERGRAFNSSDHPDSARPLFLQSWELARDSGLDFHAVDAAHMMGIIETAEQSLEWNRKAMDLAERSSDPKANGWLGSLYNNVGWTYHDQGKLDDALVCFQKALVFREGRKQEPQIRIARWCVARTLRSLGRTEEALAMQEALQQEFERIGEEDGYVREELGECLLALTRTEEARPHFARAYELLSKDAYLAEKEAGRLTRLKELGAGR